MDRTYSRLAVLIFAVALVAAACGKGKSSAGTTTSTTASPDAVAATDTALHAGAVQLRAQLTSLLTQSSFLTSAVAALEVAQGVPGGAVPATPATTSTTTSTGTAAASATSGPTTTTPGASTTTTLASTLGSAAVGSLPGAQAALDQNSQAFAGQIVAIYPSLQGPFLNAWRAHINAYFPFLQDVLRGDHTAQTADRTAITATDTTLGNLLNSVNPTFVSTAVADAFATNATAQESAISAIAQGGNTQYDSVRTAASSMIALGEFLAHGIATKDPKTFSGNVDSKSSFLLVGAESALETHAYLTALAERVAIDGGDVKAVNNTLRSNSEAVDNIVIVSYGAKAGADFLATWQRMIDALFANAQAVATGDSAGAAKASADATTAGQQVATQLTALAPGLPSSFGSAWAAHVSAQITIADDQAAHRPAEYQDLASDGLAMATLGSQLANAIALQFPNTYTG